MNRRTRHLPLPTPAEVEGLAISGPVTRAEASAHFDALPQDVMAGARLADGRLLLEFPEALTFYPADPLAVRRAFVALVAERMMQRRKAAETTMIPTEEAALLINTVDRALALEAAARPGDGLEELEYGLERARALRASGEPEAEELVPRWVIAVENFRARILPVP